MNRIGQRRNILAPFWTDLVVRGNNYLWFHVYSIDDDVEDHTQIDNVLQAVSDRINNNIQSGGFSASWVLVVTWDNAEIYDHKVSNKLIHLNRIIMYFSDVHN